MRGELREAFGAGTAAVVMPVSRLGYRDETFAIGNGSSGELTQELYETITAIQFGELEDRYDWNMIIRRQNHAMASASD